MKWHPLNLGGMVGIPWTWYRSISGLRPEMGTKMAEKWSLALPFSEPFFSFSRPFFRHFQARPKSIFRPCSSPFRAGGPKWIYTRSTGFQGYGFTGSEMTIRWKQGPEQRPGPENQDSQHMLNQPRGYFPEKFLQGNKKDRVAIGDWRRGPSKLPRVTSSTVGESRVTRHSLHAEIASNFKPNPPAI